VDDFRDTIIDTMPRSTNFMKTGGTQQSSHGGTRNSISGTSATTPQNTLPRGDPRAASAPPTMGLAGMGGMAGMAGLSGTAETSQSKRSWASIHNKRPMTMTDRRRHLLMSSSSKYPLRHTRQPAPRNFFTMPPKKGHYASVPWTNIGGVAHGVRGEYKYDIEGPPDKEPPYIMPAPHFLPSQPGKKSVGLGTNFGLFSATKNVAHGPEPRYTCFESTSSRMIAQSLYPMQILPTVLSKS